MKASAANARLASGIERLRVAKKWFGLGLIFAVSLALGDRAVGTGVRKLSEGPYRKTVRGISERDKRLDILFLGSSHTYSGVVPEILDIRGLSTYCLALPAAGPELYAVALESFLRSNPAPRLIAVECSYLTVSALTDPAMERFLPEFDWTTRWSRWREGGRGMPPAGLISEVARFHRDLKPAVRNLLRRRGTPVDWDRGFIPTRGVLTPGDPEALRHLILPVGEQMLPAKTEGFEDLLARIAELGITGVVYEVPEYIDALGPDFQTRRPEFESWLAASVRGKGLGLLSYNDDLSSNSLNRRPELFRNGDHLNADGGRAFSRIFGADLLEYIEAGS